MWSPTSKEAKYGVAIYSFSSSVPNGLVLKIGETVHILEECQGWYRGVVVKDRKRKGIFPASFIRLLKCQVDVEGPEEHPTPVQDPVVSEVAYVLQEWHAAWHQMYLRCAMNQFHLIHKAMLDLVQYRHELVSDNFTKDQIQDIKTKVTAKIDTGNKRLGLDLVPRKDGVQVDPDAISPVELYHIHDISVEKSQQEMMRNTFRHKSSASMPQTHHLYVACHTFECSLNEEAEIHFALYDAKTTKFFSENFVVRTARGISGEMEQRITNGNTLFTDLGSKDLVREVYLVAHVYRIGSLKENESSKVPTMTYRRPYGCGAIPIKDIFLGNTAVMSPLDALDNEPKESLMKGFACNNDNEFPQLVDNIIRKQYSKSFLPTTTNSFLMTLSLRMLHGDLPQVRKREAVLLRNISITQKMGFADVIMPETLRNDLYLTLSRGEFERGSKSAAKNIEVRVSVIDRGGRRLENCISAGAGTSNISCFNSSLYYHNNTPKWNETVRLIVPFELFNCCHIRLEYRHCSRKGKTEKKLFGFSFVKLVTDDQTTLCDGLHELLVYKCDDVQKIQSPKNYLCLPSGPAELRFYGIGGSLIPGIFRCSDKETVFIETTLCSTKLTQNVDLLGLLKWKDHLDKIDTNLEKLINLDGEEIVKYLQDIMDALFHMFALDHGNRIPQAQLVFKALVFIFNLLEDHKFINFKPVMDNYLENHFSAVLVYRDMLICLKEMLEAVLSTTTAPSLQQQFQRSFKSLGFIAKFIVQSQLLFRRAYNPKDNTDFVNLLNEVMDVMCQVLKLDNDVIAKTQYVIVEHLPEMFQPLSDLLSISDICSYIFFVLSAIPRKPTQSKSSMNRLKLSCLKQILQLPKLTAPEPRSLLLPLCISQLKVHMVHQQEINLCTTILGNLLIAIHADKQEGLDVTESIQVILVALLDVTIQTVSALEGFNPRRAHLVACIIAMLRLMDDNHQDKLLKAHSNRQPFKEFLMRIFGLFLELTCMNLYPPDWVVMKMVTNNTILLAMQFLSQTLSGQFLEGTDFDMELWSAYFNMAVSFLTQPSLQLEKFSEAKQQRISQRYGDMRVRMAYEVIAMWQNLGSHKIDFIPSVVGLFLDMTLVRETELRSATIPIFYDIIECEQTGYGNFKQVAYELMDKMDLHIGLNKGDMAYIQLFNSILLKRVEESAGSDWAAEARNFIQNITGLVERLLDYRSLMEGEEHKNQKMTCTLNLLNFYKKEVDRPEMYVRYIHKLFELHLQQSNFTEAGLTLLLHAELLGWGEGVLGADSALGMPNPQAEWLRKEQLYMRIIQLMDQGKSWEYGIPLCKELAEIYEKRIAYDKLSKILQTQAQFYVKILKETRPDPEYFKVGFFGQGFPPFLRNKEFVYRGQVLERIANFQKRLKEEFDKATFMSGGTLLDDTVKNGPGQYIQLCPLRPLPDVDSSLLNPEVPNAVRNFYFVNEVDTFQTDRPFHDGAKDKNEFKSLHIDRTTVRLEQKLPGVLQWFEVAEVHNVVLSPIEVAIDAMKSMNQKLQRLILRFSAPDGEKSLNPLTMRLNGVIDAAVSGGIARYQEAFFSGDFESNPGEMRRHMSTLRSLFLDQVRILGGAMALHKRLAPPELQALHQHLEQMYVKMKQSIKESGSPNLSRLDQLVEDEEPPTPTHGSPQVTPTATPPSSNRSSGFYCESETTDQSDISGITTPEIKEAGLSLAGFGSLQGLTFAPGMTSSEGRRGSLPRTPLRLGSSGSRPFSAVFTRVSDAFSQRLDRKPRERYNIASDPMLSINQGSSSSLAPATSSISLDSGIGQTRSSAPAGQQRTSETTVTDSSSVATLKQTGDYEYPPPDPQPTKQPRVPARKSRKVSDPTDAVSRVFLDSIDSPRSAPPIPPKRSPSLQQHSPRGEEISPRRPRRSAPAIPTNHLPGQAAPPPIPSRFSGFSKKPPAPPQ